MAEIQGVRPGAAADDRHEKPRRGAFGWLHERKVRDLVLDKRRLVEVPYTASLAHTVNALIANRVSAVPVAAPPGHWLGAGGSLILESDPVTGAVRKHYIGMVTMIDVLAHISELRDVGGDDTAAAELDRLMAVPVSAVIGHSLEGLSLWTLNPTASVLDCMETLSKGVHRALVPLESQAIQPISAVELVEASPGYRMLTQMDVLSFLLSQQSEDLKEVLSRTVADLGAMSGTVFAVGHRTRVIDAIKAMRAADLTAVPVVDHAQPHDDGQILQDGKGRRITGTFSATDVRGCPMALLRAWLGLGVAEFKERLTERASAGEDPNPVEAGRRMKRVVTCCSDSSLFEAMELAVSNRVHRVWVVGRDGSLTGLVSLTDMLRVARGTMLEAAEF